MTNLPKSGEVLHFWFHELSPKQHFRKDEALDSQIRERFGALHAALCESSDHFPVTAYGRLATIIVFDQFSRNMFRGSAKAFATDERALRLARRLVADGEDVSFAKAERIFVYMPFMHAEAIEYQEESLRLFEMLGDGENLDSARRHYEVIRRFGRFSHRNDALGRPSTPEEIEHLATPGTAF